MTDKDAIYSYIDDIRYGLLTDYDYIRSKYIDKALNKSNADQFELEIDYLFNKYGLDIHPKVVIGEESLIIVPSNHTERCILSQLFTGGYSNESRTRIIF